MALIFIVEDDRNIQEIESYALRNVGYHTEEFDTAKKFWSRTYEKIPDLIVLDIMLPDEDGLSIVKKLRDRAETRFVPVIMVTAKTTELDRVKGLDSGADDYLVKPFGVMELLSRVKALLRRSMLQHQVKKITVRDIVLDDEKRRVSIAGEEVNLTYKEFELLKMLMNNIGIVLQREDVMIKIWGMDYEGESRTLDMHIKTLRKKMGEAGKCICTVRNVGYRMD